MLSFCFRFTILICTLLTCIFLYCAININSILEKNKFQIEESLEQAFDRELSIGKIELNLMPFRVEVLGFSFCMEKDCSSKLAAKKSFLKLNLWDVLFSVLDNNLNGNLALDRDFRGTLTFVDVAVGKELSLKTLDLKNFQLVSTNAKDWILNSSFSFSGLNTPKQASSYKSESAEGELRLNYRPEKETKVEVSVNLHDIAIGDEFKLRTLDLKNFQLVSTKAKNWTLDSSFSFSGLNIQNLSSIYKSESAEGELSLNYGPEKETKVEGSVTLQDIAIGAGFKLKTLAAKELQFKSDPNKDWTLDSLFALSALNVEDRGNFYKSDSANGSIKFKSNQTQGTKVNAECQVHNFSFQDSITKVFDVNARLNNISTVISKDGGILVNLDIDGSSVQLRTPAVVIHGAKKVVSPLKIEIPAGGGYRVSGPVTVRNAKINTLDREFLGVSSTVDMLISKPLKSFKTESLIFDLRGEKGKLKTDFSMQSGNYSLSDTRLDFADGQAYLDARLFGKSKRLYTADLKVKDVKLARVADAVVPNKGEQVGGIIKELSGSIKGELASPLATMQGNGAVRIQKKLLSSFRLTRALRKAISLVPILGQHMVSQNSEEDEVQWSKATFDIQNENLLVREFVAHAERYNFKSSGKVSFDGDLDLQGSVIFLEETGQTFGIGIDQLSSLLGQVGKVEIPLFITGQIPDIEISVDKKTLLKDNSGITLVERAFGGVSGLWGDITGKNSK